MNFKNLMLPIVLCLSILGFSFRQYTVDPTVIDSFQNILFMIFQSALYTGLACVLAVCFVKLISPKESIQS